MLVVITNYVNINIMNIPSLTSHIVPGTKNVSINVCEDFKNIKALDLCTILPGLLDIHITSKSDFT